MPAYNRIAIIGLGLIGSSIARSLSAHPLARHIAAFDSNTHAMEYALTHGFATSIHLSAKEAAEGADIVLLAVPPAALATIMADITLSLKQGAVITDVASVKCPAVSAIKPMLPSRNGYVPAHPVAGSEQAGVEAGKADLFSGKMVILTPEEADVMSPAVAKIKHFWENTGAKVYFMPPEIHDLIYGYVSHLPQIIAFAMAPLIMDTAINDEYGRFIRLTHSPATLWADICLANSAFILEALEDFIDFTLQIQNELTEKKPEADCSTTVETLSLLTASLVASCLAASASLLEDRIGADPRFYAGKGFADMTVLARGNTETLLEAVSQHSAAVSGAIAQLLGRIENIRQAIQACDKTALQALFLLK